MSKYKKVHQAFLDLQSGLERARSFYSEMRDTVESLSKNVGTFVENRRSEGSQLLQQIENSKSANGGAQAEREQQRMKELMERMSINPSGSPALSQQNQAPSRPAATQHTPSYQTAYNPAASPPVTPGYGVHSTAQNGQYGMQPSHQPQTYSKAPANGSAYGTAGSSQNYNPNAYGQMSPPAHQQFFSPPPNQQYGGYAQTPQPQQQQYGQSAVPQGYVPPPPPRGPPPQQQQHQQPQQQQGYDAQGGYPAGSGGYAQDPRRGGSQPQQGGGDPWAGLSGWK